MPRYYSPSTGTVYVRNSASGLPADIVPITASIRDLLLTKQAQENSQALQALLSQDAAT